MKLDVVKIQITVNEVGWFGLIPAHDRDQKELQQIPLGEIHRVEMRKPRNPRHHNLYWAVMEFIFMNHDSNRIGFSFYSKEQVSKYLLIRTLHIKSWMMFPDGTRVPVEESISFKAKDQSDFQTYWDEATPIIEELMGMTIEEITRGLSA